MKASELRIGSFVDVTNRHNRIHMPYGFIKKVGEIQFFKVRLYEYDKPFAIQPESEFIDIAELAPIPLTEEWLLKFGFVQGRNYPGWVLLKDLEKGDYIDDNVLFEFFEPGYDHIKYVHQLQNLYFALTGEELTIKE
jgi:hypothetical protein